MLTSALVLVTKIQKYFVGMEVLHFVEVGFAKKSVVWVELRFLDTPMITFLHSCLDVHLSGIQSHATISK